MCYICAIMPPTDDPRWKDLHGGYRTPYDPRPALQKIESNIDVSAAWSELWNELHHQGDVGEASYAAIPELVRICQQRRNADWNTYALIGTIELARDDKRNPPVPVWLEAEYAQALQKLAELGVAEIANTTDRETVRAILSIVALYKGLRTLGRIVLNYSEDELLEMENRLLS